MQVASLSKPAVISGVDLFTAYCACGFIPIFPETLHMWLHLPFWIMYLLYTLCIWLPCPKPAILDHVPVLPYTLCIIGFSVQSLPFWIMCLSCCTHCAYGFSVQSLPFWIMCLSILQSTLCMWPQRPKPAILNYMPVSPAVHIVHMASTSRACHSGS